MSKPLSIAILGASGYTGAELLRLLVNHPRAKVVAATGESQAGKPIGEVFPHLNGYNLTLVKHESLNYDDIDVVFCCLPHGTTQPIIAALPKHVKIVDLSADFRLFNDAAYQTWYGHAHQALALQKEAVYGLTELARDAVKNARLVANPGCYPTSILLPTLPLIMEGLIDAQQIVASSMSGVSGAGRKVAQANLFTEINEGVRAYGVGGHRHAAEIEQELSNAAGQPVIISFTPHLIPMNRGISSTLQVVMKNGVTVDALHQTLQAQYANEPFLQICAPGIIPGTHEVRGTNQCRIGIAADRQNGRAIIVSVIDNLVKGASGQAIQNMNVMFGLEETTGLRAHAVFP